MSGNQILLIETDLYVSLSRPVGCFTWIFAHIKVEEWKSVVIPH